MKLNNTPFCSSAIAHVKAHGSAHSGSAVPSSPGFINRICIRYFLLSLMLLFFFAAGPYADSLNVDLLGSFAGGVPEEAAVSGNYAYVAAGGFMYVVDISNKSNPVPVAYFDTIGTNAMGICISGNYAYVALYSSGVQIIDISNPLAPVQAGYISGSAIDVSVSGSYAYVATYSGGIRIIDVSTPDSPVEVASYDVPGASMSGGVYAYASHAYLTVSDTGLFIMDISIPDTVNIVAHIDTPGSAGGVFVSGNYAYIADGASGLRVIDISTPDTPVETGSYNTPGSAYDVYVSSGYAYVADSSKGIRVVNVSNPYSPGETGFFEMSNANTRGIFVLDGYAYAADIYRGLRILDISNPASPLETGAVDLPGDVSDVQLSGNIAFCTDSFNGLRAVNVANPAAPFELGKFKTGGNPVSVALFGNHAFVADQGPGIRVIDISDPSAMTEAGYVDTYYATDVVISDTGTIAYLADADAGLKVIDISSPDSPSVIGVLDTPGSGSAVCVSGNYAYIADGSYGLRIIDISDPSAPSETGYFDTSGYASAVFVSGNYAYVGDGTYGLRIIDVSNPVSPSEVGSYNTPDNAYGVFVQGDYAYVSDFQSGLRVIDISNPVSPTEAGYYDTPGALSEVYVSGSKIYAADNKSGLWLLDHPAASEYWDISGVVTDGVNPVQGVLITLTGGAVEDRTTSDTGYFIFKDLPAGATYTLSASKTHWSFNGPFTYDNLSSDIANADFSGTLNTWDIGGIVMDGISPMQGVLISLTGGAPDNRTTSDTGYFIFKDLNAGATYTLTPSKEFYTFSPADKTYSDLSGDKSDSGMFTGTLNTYYISGVITEGASPMQGVTVSLTGAATDSTSTSDTGYFIFKDLNAGATYTLTPSKTFYSFSPPSRTIVQLNGNKAGQDFSAGQNTWKISGVITDGASPIQGVSVALSGDMTDSTTTSNTGFYIFAAVPEGGDYTVTPSKTHWTFDPTGDSMYGLMGNWTANFTGTLNTWDIGGVATDGVNPIQGVTISLTGGATDSTTTSDTGYYVFKALDAGATYTLSAAKTHWQFTGPLEYSDLSSSIANADLTGTLNTWEISGVVTDGVNPLQGVLISLSGGFVDTRTTSDTGYFIFKDLDAGATYTVSPSLANYAFTPISRTYADLEANKPWADFTGTLDVWDISGIVTDGVNPLQGITVSLSGASTDSTTTSDTGFYIFSDLPAGQSYTVTPSSVYYNFTPSYSDLTLTADAPGTDFEGALGEYSIYGTITDSETLLPLESVKVTLSGDASATVYTDANGEYTFSNLQAAGDYTITPAKSNWTFTPTSASVNNLGSDVGQNFSALNVFIADADSVFIYPNPVSDEFKIDGLSAGCKVKLFTSDGFKIAEWDVTGDFDLVQRFSDLTQFKFYNGRYMIYIKFPDGSTAVKPLYYYGGSK